MKLKIEYAIMNGFTPPQYFVRLLIQQNVTLIISDGEVGIDVLFGDHGEVEVVSLHRVIWIHCTKQLNDLQEIKAGNMSNTYRQATHELNGGQM